MPGDQPPGAPPLAPSLPPGAFETTTSNELLRLTLETNSRHATATQQLVSEIHEIRAAVHKNREIMDSLIGPVRDLVKWLDHQQQQQALAAADGLGPRLRRMAAQVLDNRAVQTVLTSAATAAILAVAGWAAGVELQVTRTSAATTAVAAPLPAPIDDEAGNENDNDGFGFGP